MKKVSARWVPKLLNDFERENRMNRSIDALDLFNESPNEMENSLVTSDESWIHHYEPESKRQSMQWKTAEEPTPIKAKAAKSAGKVLLTIFCDAKGVLLTNYLEKGRTMTGPRYADLIVKLHQERVRKRRGDLRRGVWLLHDTHQRANLTLFKLHSENRTSSNCLTLPILQTSPPVITTYSRN